MMEVCVAIGIGSRCIRVGFSTIFVSSLYNRYKATKKRALQPSLAVAGDGPRSMQKGDLVYR